MLGNNTVADMDTPLPQHVDLVITKTNGQTSYVPGAPVTYTLVVTNSGPSTATGVNITDAARVDLRRDGILRRDGRGELRQ